ncbi:hypothetical protein JT30_3691 [Burkholderia pseudomallei]|nr:hypothetical protein JT30_3691 [Burkholderia pseudomallei]
MPCVRRIRDECARPKKNGVRRTRPTRRPNARDTVVQRGRPSADGPKAVLRCGTGAVADDAAHRAISGPACGARWATRSDGGRRAPSRAGVPARRACATRAWRASRVRRPRRADSRSADRLIGPPAGPPAVRGAALTGLLCASARARRAPHARASRAACARACTRCVARRPGRAARTSVDGRRRDRGADRCANRCAPPGCTPRPAPAPHRPCAALSHAHSAASHQISASLPRRASSARGAKPVRSAAIPRRVSLHDGWHGTCLAIEGRLNDDPLRSIEYRSARQRASWATASYASGHSRPGSQDAVFVW